MKRAMFSVEQWDSRMTIGCCLGVGKDFLFLSLKMKGTFYTKNNWPFEKIFHEKNCVQPVRRWSSLGFILFLQTIHKHYSIHKLLRVTAFSHLKMNSVGMMMISILLVATVSVEIVGTLCCLLALPLLVCKIWWVNCNKQYWEYKETGQK